MARKLIVLFMLVGLLQVHASNSDDLNLYEEDEILLEGSAFGKTMPSDDEDMIDDFEVSGSGMKEENQDQSTESVTTTTEKNFEGETEILKLTEPPKVRGVPPKEIQDEVGEEKVEKDVVVDLASESEPVSGETPFLAVIIIGGCVGVLLAICVTALLVYRMRKKDEGSYTLEEQAKLASSSEFQHSPDQEFFA